MLANTPRVFWISVHTNNNLPNSSDRKSTFQPGYKTCLRCLHTITFTGCCFFFFFLCPTAKHWSLINIHIKFIIKYNRPPKIYIFFYSEQTYVIPSREESKNRHRASELPWKQLSFLTWVLNLHKNYRKMFVVRTVCCFRYMEKWRGQKDVNKLKCVSVGRACSNVSSWLDGICL